MYEVWVRKGLLIIVFGIFVVVEGCSTTRQPESPSPELRAAFGKVGVISVGPMLGPTVLGPVSVKSETARGALRGGEIGGLSGVGVGVLGSIACGPWFPACAVVFGTVGGVGGL